MLRSLVTFPPTTKTRIQQAAKKLGYRPNLYRPFLSVENEIVKLGVMVFDITDPYCTPILRGIQNALYRRFLSPHPHRRPERGARFLRYLEMLLDRPRSTASSFSPTGFFVDIKPSSRPGAQTAFPTAMISRELKSDSHQLRDSGQ